MKSRLKGQDLEPGKEPGRFGFITYTELFKINTTVSLPGEGVVETRKEAVGLGGEVISEVFFNSILNLHH
jgi:hypothetical protein